MPDIRRDQLEEQYEEAATALLMDDYAEALGQYLCEQSQDSGDSMPAGLDARCQGLICKEFARQRHKETRRHVQKYLFRAAVVVFVLLGLSTAVIFSVDAFRVPVVNFILEAHEKYTTVSFEFDGSTSERQVSTPADVLPAEGTVQEGQLAGLLPDSYHLILAHKTNAQYWDVWYASGADDETLVVYTSTSLNCTANVDTENATRTEQMKLLDFEAFFIEKDGYTIIWADTERGLMLSLWATDMTYDSFMALAETVASEAR